MTPPGTDPTPMTWAVVCGDGLPVSGLLTTLRNMLEPAVDAGLVRVPITADLGYSWRPDKRAFFPSGPSQDVDPRWMHVRRDVPGDPDPGTRASALEDIRVAVARADSLDAAARDVLEQRIETMAADYAAYFATWFDDDEVDWVIAINMTLSDGVPVTRGLQRAAARRWTGHGRPGGVLYWDHDLFGSYGVVSAGERVYPTEPNAFTPLPGSGTTDRWVVVSDALAAETASYPTPLRADVAPNVLPPVERRPLARRHELFRRHRELAADRPVILAPVRLFRVKGVEISIALFTGVLDARRERGLPAPALLLFGSRDEDPDYVAELDALVAELGLEDTVLFLDGVPLTSRAEPGGHWVLDETDLLVLARETGGAVVFTPNTRIVESVGLGPALAALAGIPCAVTPYTAFGDVFGPDYRVVEVDPDRPARAGRELADRMDRIGAGDPAETAALRRNREIVDERFDSTPWQKIIAGMAAG